MLKGLLVIPFLIRDTQLYRPPVVIIATLEPGSPPGKPIWLPTFHIFEHYLSTKNFLKNCSMLFCRSAVDQGLGPVRVGLTPAFRFTEFLGMQTVNARRSSLIPFKDI